MSLGSSERLALGNEVDDRNVADLFAAAEKVRSLGDYCWEVRFTGEWSPPKTSDMGSFSLYVMEPSTLRRPKGNFSYDTFKKQWKRTNQRFKAGESALVFCVPAVLSFDQFKNYVFIPWVQMSEPGRSNQWLFIKHKGTVYARDKWLRGSGVYAFLTGVKAVQDFVCLGAGDPNVLKTVDGQSITFIARDKVNFHSDWYKEALEKLSPEAKTFLSQFVTHWRDETGADMLNRELKPGQTYTLVFTGDNLMPQGWK